MKTRLRHKYCLKHYKTVYLQLIKRRLTIKCWEFSRKLGNRIFRGCVPSNERTDVEKMW